jgi:hypothetical protein
MDYVWRDLLVSYLVGVSPEGVKFVGVIIFGNAEEASPPSCGRGPRVRERKSHLEETENE